MKKIFVLLCVIVFTLVGCQHERDPSSAETDSSQITSSNSSNVDNLASTPASSVPSIEDESSLEDDSSGNVTLNKEAEPRELKSEGRLRGEIEVNHKLPCGKGTFATDSTILFSISTGSDESELKIILTGTKTGTLLEGSITGSGDISFEIDTADEYTAVLENCSLRGVKFSIDYFVGGS